MLMREAAGGCHEQSSHEDHENTEGHLGGYQQLHHALTACAGLPPFSALAGFTPEARRAGASPNKVVQPSARAMPNPSTLQSAGRIRRAGLSGVPIIPTIQWRRPPGEARADT